MFLVKSRRPAGAGGKLSPGQIGRMQCAPTNAAHTFPCKRAHAMRPYKKGVCNTPLQKGRVQHAPTILFLVEDAAGVVAFPAGADVGDEFAVCVALLDESVWF